MSPHPLSNSASTTALPIAIPPRTRSLSSTPRGFTNKLNHLFGTSPKSASLKSGSLFDKHTAQAALLATQDQSRASSLSLPSISLSTATAGQPTESESQMTTTLFSPPNPQAEKIQQRRDSQFGPLLHPTHRYVSRHPEGTEMKDPIEDEPPYYYLLTTYISYLILIVFGHVRDFFGKRFRGHNYRHLRQQNGYAPLNNDFDNFYVRRLKVRINDCFARPITGVPGRNVQLLDRESINHNQSFRLTGGVTEALNLSSYNYLGFAQSEGPCADAVEAVTRKYGLSTASGRLAAGTLDLHLELEKLIARFVDKPSSMFLSMGYMTNGAVFSALVGKGCLVISDELNHASIRFGVRVSGAVVSMCKHNDMKHLEAVLRQAISSGQPRTHRPWKKILVVVEGLYSMEGTMCNLPVLIALKKKYKFNLFVDEAHSIGALGPRGRGVCDYFSVDPKEVDVLMGTLTKSFGANGGYIAADKFVIDKLRRQHAANVFGESPSPILCAQISTALQLIMGEIHAPQGEERLQRIAFNSRYLRLGLKRLGFIVYGQDDSPIIPVMLYNPAKLPAFSHELLKRKIAVVVVGYPATPLVTSRARFCVSSAHNKDDLDRVLAACDEIGDILQIRFSSGAAGGAYPLPPAAEMTDEDLQVVPPRWPLQEVLKRGVADVQKPLR